MSLPRILLLKQCLTKPKSQCYIRVYSTKSPKIVNDENNSPIFTDVIVAVTSSPTHTAVPVLDLHFAEDHRALKDQITNIVYKLRHLKLFHRALEVYEWNRSKSLKIPDSRDLAVQLDLISKVHGIDAAEKFFNEANDSSERMYSSMLYCYAKANLVDKSLSHFEKMKEMGVARTCLTYNTVMTLYLKDRQHEKILNLLSEMQDDALSPDNMCYRTCLKSCALTSDFDSIDKLLKDMEKQPQISLDWFMYSSVANYYIEGGHMEKAINCLQKAEGVLKDNTIGYNYLITTYAKLGDGVQVTRLWEKQKAVCETPSNADYLVMLSALVKLDKFERAEELLREWESSGNVFDSRILDALLMGYVQKELVEKAEKTLEGMISRNTTPVPTSWVVISEGYMKRLNMQKAVKCMEKALLMGPQLKGWVPKRAVISTILNWLGDHGDVEQVYEFLKLMSPVVPMNKNMYQALAKASSRHKENMDILLQRLKADDIDVNEETIKVVETMG